MIVLGALFAGAISTSLIVLVDRLGYYLAQFSNLLF